MNTTQKQNLSAVLFLFCCIPARLGLAYIAYKRVRALPYITMVIGIGFLTLYFTDARKTGAETFGLPIWWTRLRLIHGLTYILYSILALSGNKNAWTILFADTFIGLGAFAQERLRNC